MVALAAGDEALALWLPAFNKILPRQLDAGFDGFRPAADQISISEAAGFIADQPVGQRLRRLRRKKARVGVSEF